MQNPTHRDTLCRGCRRIFFFVGSPSRQKISLHQYAALRSLPCLLPVSASLCLEICAKWKCKYSCMWSWPWVAVPLHSASSFFLWQAHKMSWDVVSPQSDGFFLKWQQTLWAWRVKTWRAASNLTTDLRVKPDTVVLCSLKYQHYQELSWTPQLSHELIGHFE